MALQYHTTFYKFQSEIQDAFANFKSSGKIFVAGSRNTIKLFEIAGLTISIKSFKKPNLVNKVAYKYFRKSKARRSFEYASKLIELQIGTPKPVAFFEKHDWIGLTESYYACEHLENVFEFREVELNKDFQDREKIIRQFTKFTFEMHQKGIEFLDHSPGNTLIKSGGDGNYSFYLVDLNRMNFHQTINFKTRMKNLSRLTTKKDLVAIMSDEYAKLSGENKDLVFKTIWKATEDFQYRFARKKRIKRQLKFWKK